MNRIKLPALATLVVALFASPATAYADCGDPGQDPCTGPAPAVDQVVAIMAELTDPDKPAASKTDIVTPGFSPDEAGTIDDHLRRTDAVGLLPYNFVVTDIQPAPNNFAGAMAVLIASPATAYADPVPTTDDVVAIMAELTDPNKPAASKTDIVTPAFTPDEAGTVDDHLHRTDAAGLLPYNFVVTDIRSAPNNLAGAAVTVTGSFNQNSAPQHIVLADQGGHRLITQDAAWTTLDNFWYNATRRYPVHVGQVG